MIIILTIIIATIIAWTAFSICYSLYFESDEFGLDFKNEGLLMTLCKIYWYAIGISFILFILILISYLISKTIVCNSKNNDYPVCEKMNKK